MNLIIAVLILGQTPITADQQRQWLLGQMSVELRLSPLQVEKERYLLEKMTPQQIRTLFQKYRQQKQKGYAEGQTAEAQARIAKRVESLRQQEAERLARYKQWRQSLAYQDMMARKERLRTRDYAPTSMAQENLAYLQGQIMAYSYYRPYYRSYPRPYYGGYGCGFSGFNYPIYRSYPRPYYGGYGYGFSGFNYPIYRSYPRPYGCGYGGNIRIPTHAHRH